LVWVGVATAQYPAAVEFFSTVLGLRVEFDEGTTVELSTANGDRVQLFAPGDEYFEFFCDVGARVVPLFEVDNLDLARAELDRAGVEVIGEPRSDSTWRWIHLRGPDGNVYTLAERRSHPISSARP
jgi:catechol 2,3-dioxygenase-like lactoylglutathione lyase family enzyme